MNDCSLRDEDLSILSEQLHEWGGNGFHENPLRELPDAAIFSPSLPNAGISVFQ